MYVGVCVCTYDRVCVQLAWVFLTCVFAQKKSKKKNSSSVPLALFVAFEGDRRVFVHHVFGRARLLARSPPPSHLASSCSSCRPALQRHTEDCCFIYNAFAIFSFRVSIETDCLFCSVCLQLIGKISEIERRQIACFCFPNFYFAKVKKK